MYIPMLQYGLLFLRFARNGHSLMYINTLHSLHRYPNIQIINTHLVQWGCNLHCTHCTKTLLIHKLLNDWCNECNIFDITLNISKKRLGFLQSSLEEVSINNHQVNLSEASDFLIDGKYTFELGGKDKGKSKQLLWRMPKSWQMTLNMAWVTRLLSGFSVSCTKKNFH